MMEVIARLFVLDGRLRSGWRVGLYLLETGQRLPVQSGGDAADLGTLELDD